MRIARLEDDWWPDGVSQKHRDTPHEIPPVWVGRQMFVFFSHV